MARGMTDKAFKAWRRKRLREIHAAMPVIRTRNGDGYTSIYQSAAMTRDRTPHLIGFVPGKGWWSIWIDRHNASNGETFAIYRLHAGGTISLETTSWEDARQELAAFRTVE